MVRKAYSYYSNELFVLQGGKYRRPVVRRPYGLSDTPEVLSVAGWRRNSQYLRAIGAIAA